MNYQTSIHTFEFVHGFNSEQILPDIWANDVATTCQIFFSSMSYDHKKLFNRQHKFR